MIFYICHYSCDEIKGEQRASSPATEYKAKYIIDTLSNVQEDNIEVIVPSETKKRGIVRGTKKKILDNVHIKTFTSFSSKYRIFRIIGRVYTKISFLGYLLKVTKANDKVIVYHSLLLMTTIKILKFLKRNKIILEVEEIYSDVLGRKKLREKEMNFFQLADGYIFPTYLLDKEINQLEKPAILVHGAYREEPDRYEGRYKEKNIIHCVYAGTFDPRKGGAIAAVLMAEYLSEKYHVHILGFGNPTDTNKIKTIIEDVSQKSKAKVTFDGLLFGDEYINFIQRCDIGLSTQNPEEAFNATSFPSKILAYLANGLKVVSIRIPAVETSAIGDYMYYYDIQTPEHIAKAIMGIDNKDEYDSRVIIRNLDKEFRKNLFLLLEQIN